MYGGLPLLGGTAAAPFAARYFEPPAKVAQQENAKPQFIKAINRQFNLNIRPEQVEYIRPSQVVKPMYGGKWGEVLGKATTSQGPQVRSAAVPQVGELDTPVAVIFADPALFGQAGADGVCMFSPFGRFCVVKDRSHLDSIRHELTHSAQKQPINKSLAPDDPSQFGTYEMDEMELGVSLAELKRDYFQATGKLATSDEESFTDMIKHFSANWDKTTPEGNPIYHPTAKRLRVTLARAQLKDSQAEKEGRQSNVYTTLLNFLRDNLDQVVRADQPGMRRAPMA